MSVQPNADEPNTNARLNTLENQVERLLGENRQLRDRVETVEEENEELRDHVDELESELQRVEGNLNVAINQGSTNKDRIKELQGRELEKGAHLLEENVPKGDRGEGDYGVDVADGRLEKIQKEDRETYLRVPETDDPLGRGGSTTLAHGDLLPIQQLAQMDDDMLERTAKTKGDYLAARLWQARDSEIDNPWKNGCKGVREYIDASEMKHWIRRELGRGAVDDAYAKKLVGRTIGAMKDLTKDRIAVEKTKTGRSGVTNKERRVKITDDADIPGEISKDSAGEETDGVHE